MFPRRNPRVVQTTQKFRDPRRNRLLQNLSIHLTQVVADADPHRARNAGVGFLGADRPFRKCAGSRWMKQILHSASRPRCPVVSATDSTPKSFRWSSLK